ncbi:hypothetical protein GmHk_09G025536 [Glycine max]|nr:hypothetical protein GmHk_09G025536 [Glycine max]
MFEKAISAIRKLSKEPADWLLHKDIPKHTWARHTFDPQCKSDNVTNNFCEVLMTLFDNRRDKAATYQFTINPRVKSVLDKIVEDGRYCVVTHGGNDEYQITGLPCKHASTCIAYKRDKFEKYCHRMFSISMLIFTYAGIIHPMPELDVTNKGGYPNIDAPALKRMAGRPRKAREKIHVERPSGTQEAKRSNTLRCSTCNEFAQNSWICQRAPVKKSKEKRLYSNFKLYDYWLILYL